MDKLKKRNFRDNRYTKKKFRLKKTVDKQKSSKDDKSKTKVLKCN